ncbi:MAG TPA: hypothetical protein PKI62_08400 [bacterium]|nr:hypothetical protein [bacterium]
MKRNHWTASLMLGSAVLLLAAVAALAQPPRWSVDEQLKRLEQDLKLTAEQSKSIKTILTDQQKEMQTIREQNQGDHEAMREKMQALRKKYDDKILAVLNDAQKVEYKKMLEERAKRRQGGGHGPDNPPPAK